MVRGALQSTGPDGPGRRLRSAALRLVLLYASFAALWILLSDKAVNWLLDVSAQAALANTAKGLAFVGVTSLLLYGLLRRGPVEEDALSIPETGQRRLWAPMAIPSVLITVLTTAGVSYTLVQHKAREVARLQAIAELKVREISGWVRERQADAELLQVSGGGDLLYHRWRDTGETAYLDDLNRRLARIGETRQFQGVSLFDERGEPLPGGWAEEGSQDSGLGTAVRRAAAEARVTRLGPYRDSSGRLHLDFAVPVPPQDGYPGTVVVLHVDPARQLFPLLQTWPVPSPSGETLLLRRDGSQVLFLNELRHRADTGAKGRAPLAEHDLLAVQAVQDPTKLGRPLDGLDYRGVPSVGLVLAVPGTDWFLVAKVDRSEVYADAVPDVIWTLLAGLLALVCGAIAVFFFHQRGLLAASLQEQRPQAERLRALRLLEAISESSTDAIYALDERGAFTLFNRAASEITGKSPEAVMGRDESVLFPDAVADQLLAENRQVIQADRSITFENPVPTARGDRVFLTTKGPLHDATGRIIGLFGIARDITERKHAEQTVRESEERYRQLFDNMFNGFAYCRVLYQDGEAVDFVYLSVNQAFEAQTGLKDVVGRKGSDVIPGIRQKDPALLDIYGQVAMTGQPERVEIYVESMQMWFWVSIYSSKPEHFMAVFDVITERKRDEERIRKLSLAVEQSPESIVITDVDGRIEYVNDAFVATSGYARQEVIGQNPRILQSGKTPPEIFRAFWETLRKGEVWKGEFRNRRKDGEEYVEFALVSPIRQPDGTVTHYLAIKEDITEKKRIGEELDHYRHHLEELVVERTAQLVEARERAEGANQAKSAFLANVSHEIRTPLNAIVGLSHLLRRSAVDATQVERLGKIDAASRHLLSIVNDVLDLSKIEAGRIELEQTDFPLGAVLDHVCSLVAEQVAAKGLSIEVDGDNVPPWLRGDPVRLRQALLNYAGNALKFTERGGIVLRARLLDEDSDRLFVRFEVEDTGIGIPKTKLPALFAPFEQVDPSTTRRYGGTGLGLVITRRLAQLMNGDAGVESRPGEGSVFWFTAWLARGRGVMPPEMMEVPQEAEARLRGRFWGARVLMAEDNAINREVALELLHGVGLEVDTVEDGAAALAKVRAVDYDLVLMDIQMPRMDGVQATRAIRELPDCAELPILAMTANAFAEDRRACLDAGMNDFVPKPVVPETLFNTLLRWLPETPSVAAGPCRVAPGTGVGEPARSLATIAGLDGRRALDLARGTDAYTRLLRLFADQHRRDARLIGNALARDERTEARRLAHALKGAAGSLGARRVAEAAAAIETGIQEGEARESMERRRTALASSLAEVTAGIDAALGVAPDEDGSSGPWDIGRLSEVSGRLRVLLSSGDMEASALAFAEQDLLREGLGGEAQALLERIRVFDYEGALGVLDRRESSD